MVRSQEAGLSTCFALVLQRLQVFRMSEPGLPGGSELTQSQNQMPKRACAPAWRRLGEAWVGQGRVEAALEQGWADF